MPRWRKELIYRANSSPWFTAKPRNDEARELNLIRGLRFGGSPLLLPCRSQVFLSGLKV